MKKDILYAAASLLLLSGCGSFLDVTPQGEVVPRTDDEFAAIIDNRLNEIEGGGDEYIIGNTETIGRLEACADDLDANIRVGNNLAAYAGEYINRRQSDWREIFVIIRDCNIVIDNLKGRESASGILSAAYAIKGILYYNLIRDWCDPWEDASSQMGIPIVDEFSINDMPVRASLRESADYAASLLDASLALDPQDARFIFTEYIVKAYRAKLAFWCEDWETTSAICRDIIAHCGKELSGTDEFASMIQSEYAPKGEVLIRSHINNASELDWYFSYVRGYIASRPASSDLVAMYGDGDVRPAVYFNARHFSAKRPEARLRLSEIVLMLAESEYHQGHREEALAELNKLRRARIVGVADFAEDTLPSVRSGERIVVDAEGKPLTPLIQAILDERRRELFCEGDRWYELKRNGCPEWWVITGGLKYTTKKYLYTAPIYRRDVELNEGLTQNPGYLD